MGANVFSGFDDRQLGVVLVDARSPAVLLIRNAFGPGWQATVDGRPAALPPADFVDQGVAVPAGRHVVRLVYRDPTIGIGAIGTGGSLVLIFGVAGIAAQRRRRREGQDLTSSLGRPSGAGSNGEMASDAAGARP